jgi:hypothetical protein
MATRAAAARSDRTPITWREEGGRRKEEGGRGEEGGGRREEG